MTKEELAEDYIDEHSPSCKEFPKAPRGALKQAFLAGFEAGKDMAEADIAAVAYQQGAERYKTRWHKVADGDLPKGEDAVLIYWKAGGTRCFSAVEPYKITEDIHIIAWCEIPKYEEI
jgi:hypothetical protein